MHVLGGAVPAHNLLCSRPNNQWILCRLGSEGIQVLEKVAYLNPQLLVSLWRNGTLSYNARTLRIKYRENPQWLNVVRVPAKVSYPALSVMAEVSTPSS